MTTAQTTSRAQTYLDRVRGLLDDLPEEERAELVQDLAAHLEELEPDRIETEMGTPEAFVAEFRSTAGLDREEAARAGRSVERVRERVHRLRRHPYVALVARAWPEMRPVWVGVRGWLAIAVFAVLNGHGTAFTNFPVPRVEDSSVWGVVAVIVATVVSVRIERSAVQGRRGARVANTGLNLVVAALLVGSLVSGVLYTPQGTWRQINEREQWLRDTVDEVLPRDLIATSPDGTRLDTVLLYDEHGRPFELDRVRWELGLTWPYGDAEGMEPGDEHQNNRYPIGGVIPPVDETTGILIPTTTTLVGG